MSYPIGLTCQELVGLVSDYLDQSLEPEVQTRFELHLGACPGCVDCLNQIRQTIKASESLREESLDPVIRDALLDAFRSWHVTVRPAGDTEVA